jgi:Putative zinc-finger
MNCTDFEQQIALYVGGDLSEKELIKVEKHLAICAHCTGFMVELQESQLSLAKFGQIDIPEVVFTNLRASVLAEIAVKNEKVTWWKQIVNFSYGWRYALVTSFVAIIIALPAYFLLLSSTSGTQQNVKSIIEDVNKEKTTLPTNNTKEQFINDLTKVENQVTKISNSQSKRDVKYSYRINKISKINREINSVNNNQEIVQTTNLDNNTLSDLAVTTTTETQVKMEIQTSNPNIRIIWLVNKEEKTSAKPTNS